MKKIFFIIGLILIIIIFLILFLLNNDYKTQNIGNNIINKSADEIKEYVLNIKSYEAEMSVTINSNKTSNTYCISQKYYKDGTYVQELLEPNKVKGLTIKYDGNSIKVENTKLNLSSIYQNNSQIYDNSLFLVSFIENLKNDETPKIEKNEDEIILETKVKNGNKYTAYKKLYLNENGKPIKMEVQDISQNVKVYILYNKIEINDLR